MLEIDEEIPLRTNANSIGHKNQDRLKTFPFVGFKQDDRDNMAKMVTFIEDILEELLEVSELFSPDPRLKMSLVILTRHFEAKNTTATFLINSSGAPYATASRKLKELIDAGLIEKRARKGLGNSFTMHPSELLLAKYNQVSRRIERLVGDNFASSKSSDYYFGNTYRRDNAIQPLSVLQDPLGLAGGLRVMVHGDPTFMVIADLNKHFEQAFGCSVHQKAFSLDELYRESCSNAARKRSLFDIVAVNLPWVGEFVEKDMLIPLDEVVDVAKLNPEDFYPESWKAAHWGGRCYGIPAQTTTEMLFYRTDLFEQAGIRPPNTTDELLDAAKALHDPEKKRYGIAWNASRGTALGHTFLTIMADFGQPIISLSKTPGGYDTWNLHSVEPKPMINTQAGRKAAEFLLELMKYSPPSILSMAWYERVTQYAEGSCAMAYGYTQITPYFETNENSPAKGKTGYLAHPSGCGSKGISPVGGYILAIPSNISPERIEAAGRALAHLTSPQAQKLYIQHGSCGTPRYSVVEDAEVQGVSPIFEVFDKLSQDDLIQSWPRPAIPELEAIIQACGTSMHDLLRGQISIDEALIRAQGAACEAITSNRRNNQYI